MTLSGFVAYAGALAVAAAVPGPGVVALVARTLGSGPRSSLPMTFGLVLGDLCYLTAAVLGLAFVARAFGTAFLVIKWVGVAYLLWLAYRFWTGGVAVERIEARRGEGPLASFVAGYVLTIGNPKVMVFYLALLPAIVDLGAVSATDYVVLVALTAAVLLMVLLPYILLAARARGVLQTPRAVRIMGRTAAAFLTGAAAAIAARAA